jgi:hypothetical protein
VYQNTGKRLALKIKKGFFRLILFSPFVDNLLNSGPPDPNRQ